MEVTYGQCVSLPEWKKVRKSQRLPASMNHYRRWCIFSVFFYNYMHYIHSQSLFNIAIIQSFISGMHHYECIAPNVDINLQSGRFWATSIASFGERFIDFRSCWVVFIHVVRGRPGGLLQFSKGEAVKICLASDSSGIRAMWQNRERRHAWIVAERCNTKNN